MLRSPWTNGKVHGEIVETRSVGKGPNAGQTVRTTLKEFHGHPAPTDEMIANKLAGQATVIVEAPGRITLDKETKDMRKRTQKLEQTGIDAALNLFPEQEYREEELLALAPAVRQSDTAQIGSDAQ